MHTQRRTRVAELRERIQQSENDMEGINAQITQASETVSRLDAELASIVKVGGAPA